MTRHGCNGFRAAAAAVGLKKGDALDLGLLVSDTPAAVAGVFTRNRVQAAPVRLCRRRVAPGTCRAVIVNSGNANCCTGPRGLADAEAVTRAAATGLGLREEEVLVASTGVIGRPLDTGRIGSGLPGLVRHLRPDGFEDLARAIMTTDTEPKLLTRRVRFEAGEATLCAVAKGAGMIRPDMATMLCFAATDAAARPETLREVLAVATDRSFNRITIDGDTSTNDTVLLLANGASGIPVDGGEERRRFQAALNDLLADLARWIVRDGEGATKLVDVRVVGAASDAEAGRVADAIANSPLVKTAISGEDANWGRILAAAGRAGVEMDPDALDLFFGEVQMVEAGAGCGPAAEAAATEIMKSREFAITLDLNAGDGRAERVTCDFSIDYVKINADYRS